MFIGPAVWEPDQRTGLGVDWIVCSRKGTDSPVTRTSELGQDSILQKLRFTYCVFLQFHI